MAFSVCQNMTFPSRNHQKIDTEDLLIRYIIGAFKSQKFTTYSLHICGHNHDNCLTVYQIALCLSRPGFTFLLAFGLG